MASYFDDHNVQDHDEDVPSEESDMLLQFRQVMQRLIRGGGAGNVLDEDGNPLDEEAMLQQVLQMSAANVSTSAAVPPASLRFLRELEVHYMSKKMLAEWRTMEQSNSVGDGIGNAVEEVTCPICQDEIEMGQPCYRLPCCGHRHLFHQLCLKQWLQTQSATCPLCRTSFETDDSEYEVRKRDQEDPDRHTRTIYSMYM